MKHSTGLVVAAMLLAAACGNSHDEPAAQQTPEPAPAPLVERQFRDPAAIAIDRAAAEQLPADTAAALTIADLPRLIARIGLGDDTDSILRALREELTAWLGFDLFDAVAAASAGVDASQPVTLAWLDTAGEHIALVVAVADADKLGAALGERPALVRGSRALIPLGASADATRTRLEAVSAGKDLTSTLDATGGAGFGTDAALYVNGGAHDLGARAIAVGFTVRPDSIHSKAVAHFSGAPPTPAEWGDRVARHLGAMHGHAEVPFAHQLVRELERGTDDSRVSFPTAEVLSRLAPTLYRAVGDKLGYVVMAGTESEGNLVYYGGLAFNGALADELVALAAGVGSRRLSSQRARRDAFDQARNAGILGQIQDLDSGAFASITGTADFSSGLDDVDVYGGLIGNDTGDMQGGFGLGAGGGGTGAGGGGTGWGTIGSGRYGTIGHGGGTGSGYGSGSGRLGGRGGKSSAPRVRIGSATATGDLDKNIIRRYIRRRLPRIKYCYEKQLLVDDTLEGKVTADFVIGADGKVTSSTASGVSSAVSSCVADVIRAIEFPRPKGGGIVTVRYPFTFKSE